MANILQAFSNAFYEIHIMIQISQFYLNFNGTTVQV